MPGSNGTGSFHCITGYFYLTPIFFYGYIHDLLVFREINIWHCRKPNAESTSVISGSKRFPYGFTYVFGKLREVLKNYEKNISTEQHQA